MEQDAEQRHHAQQHGVIQVTDDAEGRQSGKSGSYQHLCAVRDNALHHTREDVEDAGALAFVDAVLLGNVTCQRAYGNDGYRVICRTYVCQAHQRSDAQ